MRVLRGSAQWWGNKSTGRSLGGGVCVCVGTKVWRAQVMQVVVVVEVCRARARFGVWGGRGPK